MSDKTNSKEKIITIEAELPIPLCNLSVYFLKKGEKDSDSRLLYLLYNKPEIVNIKVKKIVKEIIGKKKLNIMLKDLRFNYNDSDNFSHGASYFKVILKGTEKELKRIAGKNRVCFFDWKEKKL
jgi:hypothetical protein